MISVSTFPLCSGAHDGIKSWLFGGVGWYFAKELLHFDKVVGDQNKNNSASAAIVVYNAAASIDKWRDQIHTHINTGLHSNKGRVNTHTLVLQNQDTGMLNAFNMASVTRSQILRMGFSRQIHFCWKWLELFYILHSALWSLDPYDIHETRHFAVLLLVNWLWKWSSNS